MVLLKGNSPARAHKKILVVDDEDDIRLVVSTRLQRAGYTTVTAGDGRQ
jgi:CheY-like chemotaxis protein